MKIDYKDIIDELNSELEEGVLSLEDTLQILRGAEPVVESYHAIVEWYYDSYLMDEEVNTPVEEMYLPEEFSADEWKQMKEDHAALKAQYEKDKPNLIEIKVKDALTEMKQMQKLFK